MIIICYYGSSGVTQKLEESVVINFSYNKGDYIGIEKELDIVLWNEEFINKNS